MRYSIIPFLAVVFVVSTTVFYLLTFQNLTVSNSSALLSIATFLFAIFAGFFISRQGSRYTQIREFLGKFDGSVSSLYRMSSHFGVKFQTRLAEIIRFEYTHFLDTGDWDIYLSKRSTFLTDIHEAIDGLKRTKSTPVADAALMRMFAALQDLQVVRKEMIALQHERIPLTQWIMIYTLACILVVIIALIQIEPAVLASVLKGVFTTIVFITVIMLHQFDELTFFDATIGEATNRDVLEIVEGKR